MHTTLKPIVAILALWLMLAVAESSPANGVRVQGSAAEMTEARQWLKANFENPPAGSGFFFGFNYNGKPSSALLGSWNVARSQRELDERRREHLLTVTDPQTGLQVRCEGLGFKDFPAVEWVLKLKNTGKADTPILESIQALDATLQNLSQTTLHWSKGGVASFDDFAPQEKQLTRPNDTLQLQPGGGRSSNDLLPFFNAAGPRGGVVMAIGWSGEWAASFASVANGLALKAGQARTRLVLHPGEEIRTPRILLIFYRGDRWRGQNLLRRFILAHHRPLQNGKPLVAPITWGVWGATSAEVHLHNIGKIIEHRLPIDDYWIDAGWYGKDGEWAKNVGDWALSKSLYPAGMKPLSAMLEKTGRHLMVWFEPERVIKGTEWSRMHPDWVLGSGNTQLMNLGNREACDFVTNFISAKIEEFGLGCYRQDFNMAPLPYWQANDRPDRQGITEIRHIEGLYAFWDALLAKYPGLIIDNCASGGRRIDLETTSRATPFWRTDGPRDPVAHQCHAYGLQAWIPLSAISEDREGDDYEFRSSMSSALCINWTHSGDGPWQKFPANFPFDWARKMLNQYLTVRDYYYGDYYPLTSYSQDRGAWMAWQFDCPEKGEGMVQAFRREKNGESNTTLKLRGVEPDAIYTLKNLDANGTTEMTGRVLMENGLTVIITKSPGAAVITYKKRK